MEKLNELYERRLLLNNSVPYTYLAGLSLNQQFDKLVDKLIEIEKQVVDGDIAFEEFVKIVNEKFNNLNVDEVVSVQIQAMVDDGSLAQLINEDLLADINEKLDNLLKNSYLNTWNRANCDTSANYSITLDISLLNGTLIPIEFSSVLDVTAGATLKLNGDIKRIMLGDKQALGSEVGGKLSFIKVDGDDVILFTSSGGSGNSTIYDGVSVGSVAKWTSNTSIPYNFLSCNGADVSRETYKELFEVIGTTYGVGNGVDTFGLPISQSSYAGIVIYDVIKYANDPYTKNLNDLDLKLDNTITHVNEEFDETNSNLTSEVARLESMITSYRNEEYPIGRVVEFEDDLDHSNYLGFTWELTHVNRFPIGIGNETEFDTIGKTGGNKTLFAAFYPFVISNNLYIDAKGHNSQYPFTESLRVQNGLGGSGSSATSEPSNSSVRVYDDSGNLTSLPPYEVTSYWVRIA